MKLEYLEYEAEYLHEDCSGISVDFALIFLGAVHIPTGKTQSLARGGGSLAGAGDGEGGQVGHSVNIVYNKQRLVPTHST